jgi:hypothetical protein
MFSKGQHVTRTGGDQVYIIFDVHPNTQPVTCDIQLLSNPAVKYYGVPEGDLHVAD